MYLPYHTFMTESTHSKTNLDWMEEAIAKLASNKFHVITKLNELIQRIMVLETNQQQSSSPSSSSTNPPHVTPSSRLPHMKLEVPRFDGTDPSEWIFKINQFFVYHVTPEPKCLTIASFYMEGPTLAWFQWMMRNGQLTSWSGLLQALEVRFAPFQYEDPTSHHHTTHFSHFHNIHVLKDQNTMSSSQSILINTQELCNIYTKTQSYMQCGILSMKNHVGRLGVHDKTNHTLASQATLTR